MQESKSEPTTKVTRLREWRKFQISADREREQRKLPNRTYEQNEVPSSTTLYGLPLEILDIILQKSYLHWILNSSTKQTNEDVIGSLISVDVCFNQKITRQRFKRATLRYLKEFYRKTKKRSAIIRYNRNYLLENIQPNNELIASLLSLNCITEEQSHVIQRQRSRRSKNDELLHVVRYFDDIKFPNFVKCLRRANQTAIARIVENGGVAIEVKVKNSGASFAASINPQLLHRRINDLRNRTKPKSPETDKLISQLKEKDIEILNIQLNGQTVSIWIWCRCEAALQNIQKLYELNQLSDVLFGIRPSTSGSIQSNVISIDSNEFKRTTVMCPISINLSGRIDVGINEEAWGVTKLRNEIYVLCRSYPQVIRVFKDRHPYLLQKKIEMKEVKSSVDIAASEKAKCVYVSDYREKCIWKITRETGDQYKIIKWLTLDYEPVTLSVSNDGQLLVMSKSSDFRIYGSDANVCTIQFTGDIYKPRCAVETSIGNFIILHQWLDKDEKDRESWTSLRKKWKKKWVVSELNRDGQMVIRRFIPSNETQNLNKPNYLTIDSVDQVFVADTENHRVILLDTDLQWNRILCPTKDEEKEEEKIILRPTRLSYDAGKKQLIVAGDLSLNPRKGVNVYTLSRK